MNRNTDIYSYKCLFAKSEGFPDNEVVGQVKPSVYAGFKPFQEPQVHHFVHHFRNLR